jgi:hypothetical protein
MRKEALLCGCLVFVGAATAFADDGDDHGRALRGRYALVGSSVCTFSNATLSPVYIPPAGFTPTFVPIGHASSNSFSRHGVLTFNGDGTGTSATRVVVVSDPDPGDASGTSAIDSTSSFAYSAGDDGILTLSEGTITSLAVAGPRTGIQTQTINVGTLVGNVSADGKTLIFAAHDPAVETTIRPDLGVVESQRLCHRINTAIRIDRD